VFVVLYFAIFGTGIRYMLKLVAKGPTGFDEKVHMHHDESAARPARPLSAASDENEPSTDPRELRKE
jgi:cytochrome d ubiquinol oxidase subunit I